MKRSDKMFTILSCAFDYAYSLFHIPFSNLSTSFKDRYLMLSISRKLSSVLACCMRVLYER